MQKITPFLWFDNKAEEAMDFYTSVFNDSKTLNIHRLPLSNPEKDGAVVTGHFEICGQEFMVLNGGPMFKFNESISFFVSCEDQKEVDELWNKLTSGGGQEGRCGWLKDKYGLSWQIIPKALGELMGDPDPLKASRVMKCMMGMGKIVISDLQKAYDAG